jgi:hypothetical protein
MESRENRPSLASTVIYTAILLAAVVCVRINNGSPVELLLLLLGGGTFVAKRWDAILFANREQPARDELLERRDHERP